MDCNRGAFINYKSNNKDNKDNEEKEIYRILEYYDYIVIEPKSGIYSYCVFFYSGFNENAGKYLYLFKYFFENFSKSFNLNFKIYLPMLDIYSRDDYPNSYMINYDDERQHKLYSWFNYTFYKEKRINFVTKDYKDKLIKSLIDREIGILGDTEKLIFIGFSMGGRYLIYVLEKYNLKTKFNITFKSPIFMFESKRLKDNSNLGDLSELAKYFENKFFLIYSKNDKFCKIQDGFRTFYTLKAEFISTKLRVDNGYKHVVDFNCIELLRETLVSELGLKQKSKF